MKKIKNGDFKIIESSDEKFLPNQVQARIKKQEGKEEILICLEFL
jgi:hypothetical protein